MNLFVSNGPCTLGWFAEWPWMTFVKIEADDHEYASNTTKFWRENFVPVGEQFPWSKRDQRIVWSDDSYENLVRAWYDLEVIRAAAAE